MSDFNSAVVTSKDAKYEIHATLRDKLAVMSNGNIFVNENYKHDVDVLGKIAYFKNIIKDDGKSFSTQDQINYVPAEEIRAYYDENQKLSFMMDANVIQKKVIDLISVAFTEQATDIHIELQAPSTFIYFRVLGDLKLYETLTYDDGNYMCTTLYNTMTLTSGVSYDPRGQQDGNMKPEFLPDDLSGIRIATGATQGGNNFMVLRLLPAGQNTKLEDLGYAKSHLSVIRACMSAHSGGITFICGPTGSGKSTSLQAMAKEILFKAKGKINFLSIEDPVEYPLTVDDVIDEIIEEELPNGEIQLITRQKKVTYSARQIAIPHVEDEELKKEMYRKTIKAAVRQDPDRIMVGEIRDYPTADAAMQASNTGHPVVTSIHARNSSAIIDRLLSPAIGVDKYQLLSPKMLNGLIAQHLVKELCPNCKRKLSEHLDEVDQDLIERLELAFTEFGGIDNIYIESKSGCSYYDEQTNRRCIDGSIGRFVVAETIKPDEIFLQLMREEKITAAYDYWIKGLHGYTMMTHGLAKVKQGILDPTALEEKLEQITPQENLAVALADI